MIPCVVLEVIVGVLPAPLVMWQGLTMDPLQRGLKLGASFETFVERACSTPLGRGATPNTLHY